MSTPVIRLGGLCPVISHGRANVREGLCPYTIRSTSLERSVINYWGEAKHGFTSTGKLSADI